MKVKRLSERLGKAGPKQMQLDGMDKKLRNRLWNILYLMVFGDDRRSYGNGARFRSFFRAI
ncbi:MAG: hypothetical protein MI921_26520, partial [Cytophagales bacterium]|nr:hypothetical protein [Cytophagales bacterium]